LADIKKTKDPVHQQKLSRHDQKEEEGGGGGAEWGVPTHTHHDTKASK